MAKLSQFEVQAESMDATTTNKAADNKDSKPVDTITTTSTTTTDTDKNDTTTTSDSNPDPKSNKGQPLVFVLDKGKENHEQPKLLKTYDIAYLGVMGALIIAALAIAYSAVKNANKTA